MKTVEQAILDKILYIGDKIPDGVAKDKRSKFVVLGTPQELIDETTKVKEAKGRGGEGRSKEVDGEEILRKIEKAGVV